MTPATPASRLQAPTRLAVQYRTAVLRAADVDSKRRTARLSFSSATPVPRPWGLEVLDHARKSVRLDRMKAGAPVLWVHDARQHIGIVEEVSIDEREQVGRALARFGSGALAAEKFGDIQDGILRHVSVGYVVHKMVLESEDDERGPIYRVTDWEPLEISMVPIPADASVGIGRDTREYPVIIEHRSFERTGPMNQETQVQIGADRAAEDRARAAQIAAIASHPNFAPYVEAGAVQRAISEGVSVEQFKASISDAIMRRHSDRALRSPAAELFDSLSPRERQEFSICKTILSAVDNDWRGAPLEREFQGEMLKRYQPSAPHSIMIPMSVPVAPATLAEREYARRALNIVAGGSSGGHVKFTEFYEFLDLLRNRAQVMRLGSQLLSGLQGDIAFPRQATAGVATWRAENPGSDLADSDLTFGQFTMSPKEVQSNTAYTRKLLVQGAIDVEFTVRNDLLNIVALAIDAAAINGSGSSNQPLGILNQTGLAVVAIGTNGGAVTFDHIVQLETEIAEANADALNMAYLSTPTVRGRLKRTAMLGNTVAAATWVNGQAPADGEMNGYKAVVSKQVPANLTKGTGENLHAIIFGDWSQNTVAQWGAVELIVDPYSKKKQALIEVLVHAMADTNVRYVASFSAIKDADPTQAPS